MAHTALVNDVLSQIRDAINSSGESRYAISSATGISQSQLSRLMARESGLSIESLQRLADHLGLEIAVRPKRRRRTAAGKRRA